MRLILLSRVHGDVRSIMAHYNRVAPPHVATDFYTEFLRVIELAAVRPTSFSVRDDALRRVNLRGFPYHILFRIVEEAVEVIVVRHHKRHPSYGTRRR
jgi:plasmid stabilization system protein ParE